MSKVNDLHFNFTKRKLEDLKPPKVGKQTYYADTAERGLVLCVTKNGQKSFGYRRKLDGVTRRLTIGKFPDLTIDQARNKAREFNQNVANGVNVFEERLASKQEMTVRDLFNEYMNRHAKSKTRTYGEAQRLFDTSCKPLHSKKLSTVSLSNAEKFYQDLAKNSGPYVANRAIQLLRAAFNKGKLWKLFNGDNPFVGVITFKEKARKRFLSDEEAGTLMDAVKNVAHPDLSDFILLSLFTGARKMNLMAMEYSEIDWKRGIWTIPASKFKTDDNHEIGLGEAELIILRRRKAEAQEEQKKNGSISPYVFPGEGKRGHVMDFKKSWTSLRKKVNLEDVTLHDLRRSLGAAMANANVNIALVKGALGHKDLKTTMSHYAMTNNQAILEAKQMVHSKWEASEKEAAKNAKKLVPIYSKKAKADNA